MKQSEQIYYSSIELLNTLSSDQGFRTFLDAEKKSSPPQATRDVCMCAIAALVTQDQQLIDSGRKSLESIAAARDDLGYIPALIKDDRGHIAQSVDSTIWWLLAFWLYAQRSIDTSFKSQYYVAFQEGIKWLQYHMRHGLLLEGVGAGWAHQTPRSGFVLQTNALWLLFLEIIQSKEREVIAKHFLYFFSRKKVAIKTDENLQVKYPHVKDTTADTASSETFVASASHHAIDTSIDTFGNSLAVVSGLLPRASEHAIIDELIHIADESPKMLRCMAAPERFSRGAFDEAWNSRAWQHHNAASWPMIGGWMVYALAKNGKKRLATTYLEKLAETLSDEAHPFCQWYHGRTGKALGVDAYGPSAALYIMAYHAVHDDVFLL